MIPRTRTRAGGYIASTALLTPYGRDCALCLAFALTCFGLAVTGHLGGFLGTPVAAMWALRLLREVPDVR